MNTERISSLQKEKEDENSHLEMNRRVRGVRFARIRYRRIWNDALAAHDARQFAQIAIQHS